MQNPESGVSVIPALKVSRKEGAWWNPRPLDKERKAKATEVQNCLRMAAKPTSVDPALKERLLTVGYKSVDETQVVKVESRKYFDFLVDLIKSRGGCVCIGCKLDAEAVANMSGLAVVNCLGLEAGKVGGNGKEYENNPGEEVIFHKSPCAVPFYIIDDDTSGTIVQGSDGQLCLSSGAKPQHLLKGKGGYDDSCSKQTVKMRHSSRWPSLATHKLSFLRIFPNPGLLTVPRLGLASTLVQNVVKMANSLYRTVAMVVLVSQPPGPAQSLRQMQWRLL